jgi:hypothetical protein
MSLLKKHRITQNLGSTKSTPPKNKTKTIGIKKKIKKELCPCYD